ncbi:hypothetical protein R6Z07M_002961 [Ovis aries]
MGAHPARKQPPAARGRFHTLDPPLARPIRSLRHGQHGGHYHSGGERSRQPARERAPAAGTRLALSLPPSFLSLPLPRLPTHSLRCAAGPRVPGAQVNPRPLSVRLCLCGPDTPLAGYPEEGAAQNSRAEQRDCAEAGREDVNRRHSCPTAPVLMKSLFLRRLERRLVRIFRFVQP